MPEDSVIDPAAIARLHKVGGDKLVGQMIDIFLKNAPERVAAARQGIADGDSEAIEQAVHSLKSSAGNYGAVSLQTLAGRIEEQAEAKTLEDIPELFHDLEHLYEQVAAALRDVVKGLDL